MADQTDLSGWMGSIGMPTTASSGGGINWTSIFDTALSSAGNILGSRYAVPQLNPGQYIQTPGGVMYQQQAGSSAFGFPTTSFGGGSSGMLLLLLGGGALLLVLMAAKK